MGMGTFKEAKPLAGDDYEMGRAPCKRQRTPEQQAKRAAKQAAHEAKRLLVNTTDTMTHGPAIGCVTGEVGVRNCKAKRESLVNLAGPAASAGNGPKAGRSNLAYQQQRAAIHAQTRDDTDERKVQTEPAHRAEYGERNPPKPSQFGKRRVRYTGQ